jgi:hypothetical protein
MYNEANPRDDPIAHRYAARGVGPVPDYLRLPHTILDISHIVAKKSNTAFSINDTLLSSSTTFAHSNPIKSALMRPLNNEHITPENGAQPHYSSYDAESASQCIDVTGRTIADCAQQMFSMSATERIEGEWSPQIAMKRCLCPGTPDPPTQLASATMHKKGLLHGTQAAFSPDWTPQHKGLQRVCCTAATDGMGPVYGWGASAREVSGKFSTLMHLKQGDSFTLTRINSGAPLEGPDECERVCCIDAADVALTLCEWDISTRKGNSKFSKFTDLTKFTHIAVARLNWGAPLAGADNIKRMGCISAPNATVALCECDVSLREMSSKLSNLEELRKFVRIDGAHINSGAPPAGEGDGEQTRCIAATNATVALCEWDASSRKVSSKISRAMSLKKVDLVDERGQRYQTKGKFGGNGRSSRSRSPGKDNHETARGPQ